MAIEYQDTVSDGGANPLHNAWAVDVLTVDGNVFAVVGGDDDTLAVYAIDSDRNSPTYGQFSDTPVEVVDDTNDGNDDDDGPNYQLNNIWAINSIEVDGTMFVIAGGDDDGVSVFSIDSAGQLTNTDNDPDESPLNLKDIEAISTISVDDGAGGTTAYAIVGGDDNGVTVLRVEPNGRVNAVDTVDDDGTLNISNIYGMDTVSVDDGIGGVNNFVVISSYDDGVSVFQIASDGSLTNTDNVDDTASTFLKDATALETAVIDGTSYVFVGGDEDGISIFEIDASGDLTNVGNTADGAGLNLNNINDLHFILHYGEPKLFVAAYGDGLSLMSVDIANDGTVSLSLDDTFHSSTSMNTEALDGDGGIIVGTDLKNDEINSYTAPCFATGTLIDTPRGPVPVEGLRVGDLVWTLDHGPQPLRWIGMRDLVFGRDAATDSQRPVMIRAGALGPGVPERDLVVSPQHRMMLCGPDVAARHGTDEALGRAIGLLPLPKVRLMSGKRRVQYYALMLDQHQILRAQGAMTESFHPGQEVMRHFSSRLRREIYAISPRLRKRPAQRVMPLVRPDLRREDVEDLADMRAVLQRPYTSQGGHLRLVSP